MAEPSAVALEESPEAHASGDVLLRLENLSKQFPGTLALDRVNFDVRAGEVHVLFGENGAGKSTLIQVVAGVHRPSGGTIHLRGKPIVIHSVHHARQLGVSAVFQEFSLVPQLTVEENLFLGDELTRGPLLNKAALARQARETLDRLGFPLRPRDEVMYLSRAEQQMVEIAKAFRTQPDIMIFDRADRVAHGTRDRPAVRADRADQVRWHRHHLHHPPDERDQADRRPHHRAARRGAHRHHPRRGSERSEARRADDRPGHRPDLPAHQAQPGRNPAGDRRPRHGKEFRERRLDQRAARRSGGPRWPGGVGQVRPRPCMLRPRTHQGWLDRLRRRGRLRPSQAREQAGPAPDARPRRLLPALGPPQRGPDYDAERAGERGATLSRALHVLEPPFSAQGQRAQGRARYRAGSGPDAAQHRARSRGISQAATSRKCSWASHWCATSSSSSSTSRRSASMSARAWRSTSSSAISARPAPACS